MYNKFPGSHKPSHMKTGLPEKTELKLPHYAKAALICVGLYTLFTILSITQSLVVPLIIAGLVATLLTPVVDFLVRKRMNRILAISLTVIAFFSILVLVTILLSHQIIRFSQSLPMLGEKLESLVNEVAQWVSHQFAIDSGEVIGWFQDRKTELIDSAGTDIGRKVVTTGSAVVLIIVIPIYVFLILHYQPLLLQFIHRVFTADKQANVDDVIAKTKKIIQTYLVGLIFEAIIVATLYSIALLSLGIEYAILLAAIGAILNLIPYIGSIIAAILPMIIALATKTPAYALFVLAAYVGIQLIDNNFIIPKVVASRVRLNALVSIIVVIAAGMLWGIPGMFIAIPTTAIFKVIFAHSNGMKPIGYLLGDTVPPLPAMVHEARRPKKRRKRRFKPGIKTDDKK
jgi:predicted PurR-regulated permease PerM